MLNCKTVGYYEPKPRMLRRLNFFFLESCSITSPKSIAIPNITAISPTRIASVFSFSKMFFNSRASFLSSPFINLRARSRSCSSCISLKPRINGCFSTRLILSLTTLLYRVFSLYYLSQKDTQIRGNLFSSSYLLFMDSILPTYFFL